MSTTSSPTTPVTASPEPPAPGRPTGPAKAIAIIAIAAGSLLLLGTATGAVVSTARSALAADQNASVGVSGLSALDVDVSEGSVDLVFADVDEAVLEVRGDARGTWTLERDGDTLVLGSPSDWSIFRWGWGGDVQATLTLPERLRTDALDADIDVAAGSFSAEGSFGDVIATLGAGDLRLEGDAASLEVEVSAGRGDLRLADVERATISVAAGDLDASLIGAAPDSVAIDVSAGNLDLELPEATYDVRPTVSAGNLNNQLESSTRASREVVVSVSAGSVTMRPGS